MNTFSKRNFTKAILLVAFALPTLTFFQSSQIKSEIKELKVGKKAPKTTLGLEGIDGKTYNIDNLTKENGLIVIFSCNTCPFVVGSDNFDGWEKQYNDIHKIAKENNMGMVLINSNAAKRDGVDSKEEMKSHSEAQDYTMPYVVDSKSVLADAFGAKTTPHAFILDKDKKLVYKGSIDNSWDTKKTELETYLYEAIDDLVAGNKIENNNTTARGCSIKRN
jgi:peroxiredoxin